MPLGSPNDAREATTLPARGDHASRAATCAALKVEFEFELDFFPVRAARRLGPESTEIFEILRQPALARIRTRGSGRPWGGCNGRTCRCSWRAQGCLRQPLRLPNTSVSARERGAVAGCRALRRIGTTQHVDEREPWPNQTLEALLSPVRHVPAARGTLPLPAAAPFSALRLPFARPK